TRASCGRVGGDVHGAPPGYCCLRAGECLGGLTSGRISATISPISEPPGDLAARPRRRGRRLRQGTRLPEPSVYGERLTGELLSWGPPRLARPTSPFADFRARRGCDVARAAGWS